MDKGMDFKHKEVINIKDGRRMGYVQDVCADLETGRILLAYFNYLCYTINKEV